MNLPISRESEVGVIGACLDGGLETTLEASEMLPERCFYHDDCRFVFACIQSAAARGQKADVIGVWNEWKSAFPAIAFANEFYSSPDDHPKFTLHNRVGTVLDLYRRRQAMIAAHALLEGAERLNEPLSDAMSEFDSILDKAQTNAPPILEGKQLALAVNEDLERRHALDGALSGIDTGFHGLNKLTDGLQMGEVWVIGARPSVGKAQPLHSKIVTPSGMVPMGEIKVGDEVIGSNGKPIRVLGVFPQGLLRTFEVEFTDRTKTLCCAEHLWFTQTRNERRRGVIGSVKTTREIIATINRCDRGPNHALPRISPVQFSPQQDPALNPYLIGLLLGDGTLKSTCVRFTNVDKDVIHLFREMIPASDIAITCPDDPITIRVKRKQRNNKKSETASEIEKYGLCVNSEQKFIPTTLKLGSVKTRRAVLEGLLDTDGSIVGERKGVVEFSSTSAMLCRDVAFIVRSLGGVARISDGRHTSCSYKGSVSVGAMSWRVTLTFPSGYKPFRCKRKFDLLKTSQVRRNHRKIASIKLADIEPCQCISVAAEDHLYLTDDFIPTHNTALALNVADHISLNLGVPSLFVSLEMSALALGRRLASMRGEINGGTIRSGQFSEQDLKKLAIFNGKLAASPLKVLDAPGGIRINQLCHSIRAAIKRWGIKVVFLDYLQKIRPDSKGEKRTYEIGDTSSQLVELVKRENINLFALAQLNRENEKDKGRPPRLSDLADSKSIEADADFVGLLDRPIKGDENMATLRIAKQRDGERETIPLAFQGWHCRFRMGTWKTDPQI